jgi:hypothetical protein
MIAAAAIAAAVGWLMGASFSSSSSSGTRFSLPRAANNKRDKTVASCYSIHEVD